MSCSLTYCITNTGLVGADDNYVTGGTYNGDTYWTGQTSGWTIYYYTGITSYWCLSDTLGGTCYLTGKYPCVSSCPDLSGVYVFSGICLTPTPTPTQNCNVLDFTALFDCDYIPTPTPTPTTSVTPTVTITPTSSNICSIIGINASGYTYTPTPTPTPTVTPTEYYINSLNRRQFYSNDIVRDCPVYGSIEYTSISGEIICPGSLKFQNCYDGDIYNVSNFDLPDGDVLQQYGVYGANLNGDRICVWYMGTTDESPGNFVLTFRDSFYGFVDNGGACAFCQLAATPTPTPTITPTMTMTPTITPTMTKTPTPTVTKTPGLSPSTTPTNTPTMTKTPTQTLTQTPSSTPACSNDSVEGQSASLGRFEWIAKDNSGNYFISNDSSSGFLQYFTQSSNNAPTITNAFFLTDSNNVLYPPNGPIVYNPTNNRLYISCGNKLIIKNLDDWSLPVDVVSLPQWAIIQSMVYNSVQDRVYLLSTSPNNSIIHVQCSDNTVTILNTTGWNILAVSQMEYNPILDVIYVIATSQGQTLNYGDAVKMINCSNNTITQSGYVGSTNVHSLAYKPNSSDLYVMKSNGDIYLIDCNNFTGTPTTLISNNVFSFGRYANNSIYNYNNDKIYIARRDLQSYIFIYNTVTNSLSTVSNLTSNPNVSSPFRFAIGDVNNKVFVSQGSSSNKKILQICASPHS